MFMAPFRSLNHVGIPNFNVCFVPRHGNLVREAGWPLGALSGLAMATLKDWLVPAQHLLLLALHESDLCGASDE